MMKEENAQEAKYVISKLLREKQNMKTNDERRELLKKQLLRDQIK